MIVLLCRWTRAVLKSSKLLWTIDRSDLGTIHIDRDFDKAD